MIVLRSIVGGLVGGVSGIMVTVLLLADLEPEHRTPVSVLILGALLSLIVLGGLWLVLNRVNAQRARELNRMRCERDWADRWFRDHAASYPERERERAAERRAS